MCGDGCLEPLRNNTLLLRTQVRKVLWLATVSNKIAEVMRSACGSIASLAMKFSVALANKFVPLAIEFITLAQKFVHKKVGSCSKHKTRFSSCYKTLVQVKQLYLNGRGCSRTSY